jgi:hypothetical protein
MQEANGYQPEPLDLSIKTWKRQNLAAMVRNRSYMLEATYVS